MSGPRIEVRIGGGEWLEVTGLVLPIGGASYRLLITNGWRVLRDAVPEQIMIRVDGALATQVAWSSRPEGFATCEVVLGSTRLAIAAGGVVKAPALVGGSEGTRRPRYARRGAR